VRFKRQTNHQEDINLTPLIDVVFLLLIFFMVSTTFTSETHLKLDLPEAEGGPPPSPNQKIEVLITAEGAYSVNGENLVNNQMKTLMAAIQLAGQGDTKLPFIITADAKAEHSYVVQAMDAAGRMGYANLSITTKSPAPEPKK
jgi:biopolymer transport protein ExbD